MASFAFFLVYAGICLFPQWADVTRVEAVTRSCSRWADTRPARTLLNIVAFLALAAALLACVRQDGWYHGLPDWFGMLLVAALLRGWLYRMLPAAAAFALPVGVVLLAYLGARV